MDPPLELFVLTWGVYPRRVLIYLGEKGLLDSPYLRITPCDVSPTGGMTAPGKPAGSVPILRLPDGTFIKQSIAILDYLEDVCSNPDPEQPWQAELANSAQSNMSMRGRTAVERARTRDMLSLADEATVHFVFACHKGSALFEPIETTHALTAKLALEYCQKNLKLLDAYYVGNERLENGGPATIADCVLYSTLHFAKDMYSLDLLADRELPGLQQFWELFGRRPSVQVSEDHFPSQIQKMASQWLPME